MGCLTQAHTVTQGLVPGGGSGAWPCEPPWEVTAGSGGCFAVGRVCVCVCLCVCLGLVSSQGPLPYTLTYAACFSLAAAARPGGFSPPPRSWSLHTKAACC